MAKEVIVGIDIRDLRIAKAGARTYLEEILNQFENNTYPCKFKYFDSFLPVYTGSNRILKLIEHIRYVLWKQVILPVKAYLNNCDVLFCSDYFVPYLHLGYKTIPVFHDAFFHEYANNYNKYWLMFYKTLGISAARRAAFVVTVSEYSKNRLAHFTGINPDKIIPVHLAPKTGTTIKTTKAHSANLKLQTPKFILHVGTLEKRKNLVRLIKAFKLLRDSGHKDYSLLLVGQSTSKTTIDDSSEIKKTINDLDLHNSVIIHGYASDKDLVYFYKHAEIYVFPSVNEGFGIPVLEAFYNQLPVVVANNTSLPEVGGDAVISFDPFNEDDIHNKIKRVIEDPQFRAELIKRGNNRIKLFSWQKTAESLVDVFERAANKH